MTLFDMIALGLLALSGFAGFRKGGVREMVGFVGFTAALVFAAYALPFTAPVVRKVVHPAWAGAGAALVAGFVVSFILINLLGEWVSKQIDNSAFGGFDRAVGLGFGVVRGLIVMGLFMLAFNALVPRSMALSRRQCRGEHGGGPGTQGLRLLRRGHPHGHGAGESELLTPHPLIP